MLNLVYLSKKCSCADTLSKHTLLPTSTDKINFVKLVFFFFAVFDLASLIVFENIIV